MKKGVEQGLEGGCSQDRVVNGILTGMGGCLLTFDEECLVEAAYDGTLIDLGGLHPVSLGDVCEGGADIGVTERSCV